MARMGDMRMGEMSRPGWAAPAWVLVTILAFGVGWPAGLLVLAYLAWSGKLRRFLNGGMEAAFPDSQPGRWFNLRKDAHGGSGNQAFDDYRAETLRRLEEEQKEFRDYLERLRRARDKAEFDGFMAERRRRAGVPDTTDAT